jgi:hypothetical protein
MPSYMCAPLRSHFVLARPFQEAASLTRDVASRCRRTRAARIFGGRVGRTRAITNVPMLHPARNRHEAVGFSGDHCPRPSESP